MVIIVCQNGENWSRSSSPPPKKKWIRHYLGEDPDIAKIDISDENTHSSEDERTSSSTMRDHSSENSSDDIRTSSDDTTSSREPNEVVANRKSFATSDDVIPQSSSSGALSLVTRRVPLSPDTSYLTLSSVQSLAPVIVKQEPPLNDDMRREPQYQSVIKHQKIQRNNNDIFYENSSVSPIESRHSSPSEIIPKEEPRSSYYFEDNEEIVSHRGQLLEYEESSPNSRIKYEYSPEVSPNQRSIIYQRNSPSPQQRQISYHRDSTSPQEERVSYHQNSSSPQRQQILYYANSSSLDDQQKIVYRQRPISPQKYQIIYQNVLSPQRHSYHRDTLSPPKRITYQQELLSPRQTHHSGLLLSPQQQPVSFTQCSRELSVSPQRQRVSPQSSSYGGIRCQPMEVDERPLELTTQPTSKRVFELPKVQLFGQLQTQQLLIQQPRVVEHQPQQQQIYRLATGQPISITTVPSTVSFLQQQNFQHTESKRKSAGNGLSGTREVHNKLEKNRRAHLKECFELLRNQVPSTQDEKKPSNLTILRSAIRYIQILRRRERELEQEYENQMSARNQNQERLEGLKRELSAQWDHIDFDSLFLPPPPLPSKEEVDVLDSAELEFEQMSEQEKIMMMTVSWTSISDTDEPSPSNYNSQQQATTSSATTAASSTLNVKHAQQTNLTRTGSISSSSLSSNTSPKSDSRTTQVNEKSVSTPVDILPRPLVNPAQFSTPSAFEIVSSNNKNISSQLLNGTRFVEIQTGAERSGEKFYGKIGQAPNAVSFSKHFQSDANGPINLSTSSANSTDSQMIIENDRVNISVNSRNDSFIVTQAHSPDGKMFIPSSSPPTIPIHKGIPMACFSQVQRAPNGVQYLVKPTMVIVSSSVVDGRA